MKKKTQIIESKEFLESLKAQQVQIKERFDSANKKSMDIIEDYLSGGFMQDLADMVYFLPEDRRKAALEKMPSEVRELVQQRLDTSSQKKNDSPEVMSAAGKILKNSKYFGRAVSLEILDGQDVYYLSLSKEDRDDFYKKNPLLAMNLEYSVVSTEILTMLDDRSIQKILREVDSQTIALALKGSSDAVREKIFHNMSKRAGAMILEDMEFMGPVLREDFLRAAETVISIMKRLEDAGEIIVCCAGNLPFYTDKIV